MGLPTQEPLDKFIFAIDPSINNVGWCYLFCNNNTITLLDCGIFHNNLDTVLDKMNYIFQIIQDKIKHLIIKGL